MQNTSTETLEVKRGGYAQYFIYLPLLLLFAVTNSLLKIPPPYLYYVYIAVVVLVVLNMNKLQKIVFIKPLIIANKHGLWTRKLNLVPWHLIKDIRIEKTSSFNTANMTANTSIDLIIETNDGYESSFWGGFLDQDPTMLCTSLKNYWQTYR